MATIEPRLIHLLNESTTPQLSNNDLPPLHSLPLPESPDRPLPPLDPEGNHGGHRGDRLGRNAPPGGSSGGVMQLQQVAAAAMDESTYTASHRKEDDRREGRYAGSSAYSTYPLRLLLGEGEAAMEHSHSLMNILDDGQDLLDEGSNKKRGRTLNVKDDFVQLPQPVKKQKATQQAHVMPPIINGLLEPPPHAALFPPIASNSFDDSDATQIKLLHDFNHASVQASIQPSAQPATQASTADDRTSRKASSEPDKGANKVRKRATRPRRKWSEEETKHLLLGVNRHGVGKWTNILDDADFKFNERSAGDLKDRFRTCCPDELRGKKDGRSSSSGKQKAKTGIYSENILIDEDDSSAKEPTASPTGESDPGMRKKSRAHRKKMEDLAELGIHGPFKKSHRRERRPFTEQDDHEILEGLDFYGPAWTKIQRDARFHLSSRQPTDLRDRVRNKYPAIYQSIEKGTFQTKDARGNGTLEPSINMSIDGAYGSSSAAPTGQAGGHRGSREDLSRWPFEAAASSDYQTQAFAEFGEPSAPPTGGEMDISRLLLDDSRISQNHGRSGVHDGPVLSPVLGSMGASSRKDRYDDQKRA